MLFEVYRQVVECGKTIAKLGKSDDIACSTESRKQRLKAVESFYITFQIHQMNSRIKKTNNLRYGNDDR